LRKTGKAQGESYNLNERSASSRLLFGEVLRLSKGEFYKSQNLPKALDLNPKSNWSLEPFKKIPITTKKGFN